MPSPRPRKRRKSRSVTVPPPPPASLVRLLQTDAAVLDYFTALQDALAADVQKWKARAQDAEEQLEERKQPPAKRKRQPKQQPPPSVVVTTKPARLKGVDDAAFHFLDSDSEDESEKDDAAIAVRGKTPQESQEEADAAEPTANDQHMLSLLQDDTSASSNDDDDDDDQQLQDKMDLAMLSEAAERMLQLLEIDLCEKVLVERQEEESSEKEDGATTDDLQATKTMATDGGGPPVDPEQLEPIFQSIQRKDIDVANEVRLRFADQPYNPQLAEALQVLDATPRSGIVDAILQRSSVASWMTISLQAWRGKYEQSLQALLDCLVQDDATIVLPALDACFLLDDCWICDYIQSIFTTTGVETATTMLDALAFCIRQTVDSLQQSVAEDDEAATLEFTRWNETASKHAWLDTSQESPSELITRVLDIRETLSSSEQRSTWLAISQVVLLRADTKDVPEQQLQDSIASGTDDDDTMGLLLCHVERQLTLRSSNSLPTNVLPSSLACSVSLADGHSAILCIHALLQRQLPVSNTRTWELVQQTCTIPTLRVINLERRTDRLATFVQQALRQGLLVIKGVTPLLYDADESTAVEHGSHAYDGSGRLVAAMRRLTEAVGEKEQWKKLIAEEWCPNDLKPFDRDAPATEALVGTTPSEKACALSHVSCWKGIMRAIDLSHQPPVHDFAENPTQLRLWRSPQNIVRLFKIAGFAQGRALLPKNEDMAPAPVCVVMEDDAILVDGFKEKLAAVLEELPRDFHYCSLGYSRPRSAPIVPLTGSVGVPTMLWYLTGYCVSLAGAQYLLDSLPVVGPVDSWIGLKMVHENWRDSAWGTRLGVGAHAQPDAYPNRAALASLMKFHAYCAVPPLCCQPVGKAAATTNMRGTVVAPTSARRNWRLRDTDIVYSGDFAKLVV